MGRVARLLIAAAVAVPLLASAPGPAVACTCLPLDAHQIVRRADAIIAGRVTNEIELDPTHTRSVVQVQGVYTGHVSATVNVDADLGPGGGSTCAVLYPVGSEVDPMLLVHAQGGSYRIDPCLLGSGPHVRALLGEARPPPQALPSPSAAAGPIPGPIAGPTPVPGMSWPAVVAGLVLAVALIVAAVRWTGRGAVEPASPFDDLPAGPDGGTGGGSEPDDGVEARDPPDEDASG